MTGAGQGASGGADPGAEGPAAARTKRRGSGLRCHSPPGQPPGAALSPQDRPQGVKLGLCLPWTLLCWARGKTRAGFPQTGAGLSSGPLPSPWPSALPTFFFLRSKESIGEENVIKIFLSWPFFFFFSFNQVLSGWEISFGVSELNVYRYINWDARSEMPPLSNIWVASNGKLFSTP